MDGSPFSGAFQGGGVFNTGHKHKILIHKNQLKSKKESF